MVKRWILQVAHACNKALTLTFNESGQKDCLPKERGALRGAGVMLPRRLEILWRVRSLCSQGQSLSHCETFMAPPRGDTQKVTFERAFGLRKRHQRAIR